MNIKILIYIYKSITIIQTTGNKNQYKASKNLDKFHSNVPIEPLDNPSKLHRFSFALQTRTDFLLRSQPRIGSQFPSPWYFPLGAPHSVDVPRIPLSFFDPPVCTRSNTSTGFHSNDRKSSIERFRGRLSLCAEQLAGKRSVGSGTKSCSIIDLRLVVCRVSNRGR